eukprot:COSAG06_NODE_17629_length_929_cov_2.022892_1_plen_88_part_10
MHNTTTNLQLLAHTLKTHILHLTFCYLLALASCTLDSAQTAGLALIRQCREKASLDFGLWGWHLLCHRRQEQVKLGTHLSELLREVCN